jgi:hypothetical protein
VTPRAARRTTLAVLLLGGLVVVVWEHRKNATLEARLADWRDRGYPITRDALDAWYPRPPEGENAATLSLNAAGQLKIPREAADKWTDEDAPPPTAADLAEARELLDANTAALVQIHQALSHGSARYPVDFKAPSPSTAHFGPVRALGASLRAAAVMAAATGQPHLAAQCLGDALRQACTFEFEPSLTSLLMELMLLGNATDAAERLLSSGALQRDDLSYIQSEFEKAAGAVSVEHAAAGAMCDTICLLSLPADQLARTLVPRQADSATFTIRLYHWVGLAKSDEEAVLDHLAPVALANRLSPRERAIEMKRLHPKLREAVDTRFLIFGKSAIAAVDRCVGKSLRAIALLDAAATACAVERWRLDHHGDPPAGLSELTPDFLPAVPMDPGDGRPLKYRRRAGGYLVYAVGEEGVDHGGVPQREAKGQKEGWDYAVCVEKPSENPSKHPTARRRHALPQPVAPPASGSANP